jgi:hypothetical protein
MAARPDLADPQATCDAQDKILVYAREVHGLSREQVAALVNSDRTIRSSAGQLTWLDAAERHHDKKALKNLNAHQRHVPPPQRPGIGNGRAVGSEAKISQLGEQLRSATGNRAARLGAELLRARRAR